MMVGTQDQAYIAGYNNTIHVLLQQKDAKLRGIFQSEIAKGESHPFERVGTFSAHQVTSRGTPTIRQDPTHSRRVAFVTKYAAAVTLSDIDAFKMLIDPSSTYIQGLVSSLERQFDRDAIAALIGNAASGQHGETPVALPDAQKILHNETGITPSKLNEAMMILQAAEANTMPGNVYMLVDAYGLFQLYEDESGKIDSFDFVSSRPLDTNIITYRGLKIIQSQQIPLVSTGVHQAIMFTREAARVAESHMPVTFVDRLPDYNQDWQAYVSYMFGLVRMEDELVVQVQFK